MTLNWAEKQALIMAAATDARIPVIETRLDTVAPVLSDEEQANQDAISTGLEEDLVKLQAILDQTNADLNANPAQEIKDLARVARRLIRKVEHLLDGVD